MSTALELIEDAFEEIGVKINGVALDASYISRAVRSLNLMMNSMAASEDGLGFSRVLDSANELTIPEWSEDYVASKLAMRLAGPFGRPVSPELGERYRTARKAYLRMTGGMPDMGHYPPTLPMGSGNAGCGYGNQSAYYGDQYTDDVQDASGDILEDESGNILEI